MWFLIFWFKENVRNNQVVKTLKVRTKCQLLKSSLINYNNPILVNTSKGNKSPKKHVQETKTNKSEDILNSILPPRYVTLL